MGIEELEIRESEKNKNMGKVLKYRDRKGNKLESFYPADIYIAEKVNEIIKYIKSKE